MGGTTSIISCQLQVGDLGEEVGGGILMGRGSNLQEEVLAAEESVTVPS